MLYLIGSDPLVKIYRIPRCPEQPNQQKLPQAQLKIQNESSTHEESSSSDQEQNPQVFIQQSQAQLLPNMVMPYIKGPEMDSQVNDALCHRFLKWHLRCENILECKLVMLPEKRQGKKVIARSGDFSMDQCYLMICCIKFSCFVWAYRTHI